MGGLALRQEGDLTVAGGGVQWRVWIREVGGEVRQSFEGDLVAAGGGSPW